MAVMMLALQPAVAFIYSKHDYLTAASSVLWLISRSRKALVKAEHVHAWTDITNRQYVTTSVSVSEGCARKFANANPPTRAEMISVGVT